MAVYQTQLDKKKKCLPNLSRNLSYRAGLTFSGVSVLSFSLFVVPSPACPTFFFFFFSREIGGNVEKITSRLQRRLHEAQVELLLCPVEGGPFFFISGSRECLDLCKTRTRHFVVRAGARSHLQWYTFTTVERGDNTAHLDSLFARSLGPITGRYQFPVLVTVVEVNS